MPKRSQRDRNLTKGMCVNCGIRKPIENLTTCQVCRDNKEKSGQRRLDEGFCIRCSNIRDNKDIDRCDNCTRRAREHSRNAYRKKKGIPIKLPIEKRRYIP